MAMNYFLLDSRAGWIATQNDGNLISDDPGKYVLYVGTLKECCKYANSGEYGENNVVSDENFIILWQLYNEHGHWSYKSIKNEGCN
jgi:hypothetical protein